MKTNKSSSVTCSQIVARVVLLNLNVPILFVFRKSLRAMATTTAGTIQMRLMSSARVLLVIRLFGSDVLTRSYA